MNDVVFVTSNTKLGKKKEATKEANYDIEDVCFHDDWIVEDKDDQSSYMDLDENIQVREDVTNGVGNASAHIDDFEFPHVDDDEEANADSINKNEYDGLADDS